MTIDKLFDYHKLNQHGLARVNNIAVSFDSLLGALEANGCQPGREFSIVKTKLEEACMFAKKAVALDPANQEI